MSRGLRPDHRRGRSIRAWLLCAALLGCLGVAAGATPRGPAPAEARWRLNADGTSAYEISLAVRDGRLGAAWQGGSQGRSQIWFRVTDAHGRPVGAPVALTDGARAANEPDLRATRSGWVIAWYEKEPRSGALQAWLAGLDARGQVRWRTPLSRPGRNGRSAIVRVRAGAPCAVWLEEGPGNDDALPVMSQCFDARGAARDAARAVGSASRQTWNLNADVYGDGTLYVVFDARLGTRASELQLLRIDARGAARQRPLSGDDGFASVYPDIAIGAAGAAIAWSDRRDGNGEIYLAVVPLEALQGDAVAERARRITQTEPDSSAAYLAWNGAELGLAWNEEGGSAASVWLQRFDAAGSPRAPARNLTPLPGASWIPAIRRWRQGFALAWDELTGNAGGPADEAAPSTAWLELVR